MFELTAFPVVVFDLDDTLYSEADYVASGFRHLSTLVDSLYHRPFGKALQDAHVSKVCDPIGTALLEIGLPLTIKDDLIQAYRYHHPVLSLLPGAQDILNACMHAQCKLYLITDGRGITQRLKIQALGLQNIFDDVFISEELGASKPHPLAFVQIQRRHPKGPWIYLADNPQKDFLAPRALGWASVGVRHTTIRTHSLFSRCDPQFWVEDLQQLL